MFLNCASYTTLIILKQVFQRSQEQSLLPEPQMLPPASAIQMNAVQHNASGLHQAQADHPSPTGHTGVDAYMEAAGNTQHRQTPQVMRDELRKTLENYQEDLKTSPIGRDSTSYGAML